MSEAGVIPPERERPREIGRVTGPTARIHHYPGASTTATLRTVVCGDRVQIGIGKENVWLDRSAQEEHARHYLEAVRQAEEVT